MYFSRRLEFDIIKLKSLIGIRCYAWVLFNGRAQSGNVANSGYTMAPHVGNVAHTTTNVKIDGPIPAIACKGTTIIFILLITWIW